MREKARPRFNMMFTVLMFKCNASYKFMMTSRLVNALRNAIKQFKVNNVTDHAAALSYYTVLSLPGIALMTLLLLGYVLNASAVERISEVSSRYMGVKASNLLVELFSNLQETERQGLFGLVGLLFLLYSGANSLRQMEHTLNLIWEVPVEKKHIVSSLIRKTSKVVLLSMSIVLIFILGLVMGIINNLLRSHVLYELAVLLSLFSSLLILVVLFMILYKSLHNVSIRWNVLLRGATLAGIIFITSQFALSYYFTVFKVGSAYGSTGAFVVLLLWIFVFAKFFTSAQSSCMHG